MSDNNAICFSNMNISKFFTVIHYSLSRNNKRRALLNADEVYEYRSLHEVFCKRILIIFVILIIMLYEYNLIYETTLKKLEW